MPGGPSGRHLLASDHCEEVVLIEGSKEWDGRGEREEKEVNRGDGSGVCIVSFYYVSCWGLRVCDWGFCDIKEAEGEWKIWRENLVREEGSVKRTQPTTPHLGS